VRARPWCFTHHLPAEFTKDTDSCLIMNYAQEYIDNVVLHAGKIHGVVLQPELSPTTGKPHLQGFISFVDARPVAAVRKILSGSHVSQRYLHSTDLIAWEYCCKEETRVPGCVSLFAGKKPDAPAPGKRNDLLAVTMKLKAGESLISIVRNGDPSLLPTIARTFGGLGHIQSMLAQPRKRWCRAIVLWGETGKGKTTAVFDAFGPSAYWVPKKAEGRQWWPNYADQRIVVYDEMCGKGTIDIEQFLVLLNQTPMQGEIKGMHVEIKAELAIFLSNYEPMQWWNQMMGVTQVQRAAIQRRLTGDGVTFEIKKFNQLPLVVEQFLAKPQNAAYSDLFPSALLEAAKTAKTSAASPEVVDAMLVENPSSAQDAGKSTGFDTGISRTHGQISPYSRGAQAGAAVAAGSSSKDAATPTGSQSAKQQQHSMELQRVNASLDLAAQTLGGLRGTKPSTKPSTGKKRPRRVIVSSGSGDARSVSKSEESADSAAGALTKQQRWAGMKRVLKKARTRSKYIDDEAVASTVEGSSSDSDSHPSFINDQ